MEASEASFPDRRAEGEAAAKRERSELPYLPSRRRGRIGSEERGRGVERKRAVEKKRERERKKDEIKPNTSGVPGVLRQLVSLISHLWLSR